MSVVHLPRKLYGSVGIAGIQIHLLTLVPLIIGQQRSFIWVRSSATQTQLVFCACSCAGSAPAQTPPGPSPEVRSGTATHLIDSVSLQGPVEAHGSPAASIIGDNTTRACTWHEQSSSCRLDWGVYASVIHSNPGVARALLELRNSTYDCMANAGVDAGASVFTQRCNEDAAYAQCKTWAAGRWPRERRGDSGNSSRVSSSGSSQSASDLLIALNHWMATMHGYRTLQFTHDGPAAQFSSF